MSPVLVRVMATWDGGDVPPDTDGFVHLSWPAQVARTIQRHYAGEGSLVLLEVDETRLPPRALRVEDTTGHGAHPHLYAVLPADAVVRAVPWRPGDPLPF